VGRAEALVGQLQHAALYVRPSLTDGQPLTVMEAMSCASPVVASDVGGTRELLSHGEEGLLVPPGSPRALAQAVIQLLDDPKVAAAMGRAARDRMCLAPDWDEVARRYERLFEAVQ
ncbi:MAG: glycosyltransferase, partial [Thermoplasmatota archaeon]